MPRRPADSAPKALLEERFGEELVAGCHIIVGFSGGADSVSLLHRIRQLREKLSLTVEAAHLNHCLRGEESLRDENFVREFCGRFDIPLTVRHVNIREAAAEKRMSEEEAGREARYEFFRELAEKYEGEKEVRIATAHTLSDDFETVLFRMARGTGLKGLCGIPEKRGNIVRPVLRCSRAMIEDYCGRMGLDYVTDSTNADTRYSRNRIRSLVIPALTEINPAAEECFLRQKLSLTEDEEFLREQTDSLLNRARSRDAAPALPGLAAGYSAGVLAAAPDALLNRACAVLLEEAEIPVDRKNVLAAARLIRSGQGRLELRAAAPFVIRKGILRCEAPFKVDFPEKSVPLDILSDGVCRPLRISRTIYLGKVSRQIDKTLWLQVISAEKLKNRLKVYEKLLFFSADYDTMIGSLYFRARISGDTLAEAGRAGEKTIKKLYSEAGLPALERAVRIVVSDCTAPVWAEGFRTDRRAAVRPDTSRILLVLEHPLPESFQAPEAGRKA